MPRLAWWLALLVFALDQLTKWLMVEVVGLAARGTVPVLPVLSLTWVENRGVSMGLLSSDSALARWALVALTAAIAAGLVLWIRRETGRLEQAALGLVLGGALGNILDRVRFAYVVDFVHLHWGRWSFYVFNVADAAITTGVVLLLARALLPGRPAARAGGRERG